MEKHYEEALRQLVQTIQRIENLAAWLELEKSESRSDCAVGFRWNSSTEQDLRTHAGAFLSQYFDILEELNQKRQSAEIETVQRRLVKLHSRFVRAAAPVAL